MWLPTVLGLMTSFVDFSGRRPPGRGSGDPPRPGAAPPPAPPPGSEPRPPPPPRGAAPPPPPRQPARAGRTDKGVVGPE